MVAQLVGIALVTAACAILLRATAPELSLAVSVAGSIVLMIAALDMLKGSLGLFGKIASLTGIDSSFLKILLKMVGVGYLVEFAAGTLTGTLLYPAFMSSPSRERPPSSSSPCPSSRRCSGSS